MITTLTGLRTIVVALFAMVCLVGGLWLVEAGQRAMAYGAFAIGIVGVIGAVATKASVDALSAGGGVKGATSALMTSAKPGDPPPPSVEVKTTTTTVTP